MNNAMNFEFDPRKAASNLRKHKVSFQEATSVFADPLSGSFRDPDHSEDEDRWIIIGTSLYQRVLFVVYTDRQDAIRIIGARLATAKERKDYEENRL
jgi:uncharacterized DUF497 family protein